MTDLLQRLRDQDSIARHGYAAYLAPLIREAAAEIARLRSELEAARADAARYRWLRSQKHIDIAAAWFLPRDIPCDAPEDVDAAIDAARKGGEG